MLLYNDYIFTLLGRKSLLPIEKRVGKEVQTLVHAMSDSDTKQKVCWPLTSRAEREHEVDESLDMDEVVWGGPGRVRSAWAAHKGQKRKHGTFRPERLPKLLRLVLGEYRATTVKRETIYATTQPPPLSPLGTPASIGVDEAGSSSGVLEVMVKYSAKKSIGVIVWCMWFDRCDGAVLILKALSTLSFIPRKSELNASELGTRLSYVSKALAGTVIVVNL
jgi:hypothetical protein